MNTELRKVTSAMCFLLMLFFAMNTRASVQDEVNLLAGMMTDQYAGYLEKSLNIVRSETSKYIVASFALEGFNQGNNVKQFLAVFIPEYKKLQEPPFSPVGEAKYRLIGYTQVCSEFKRVIAVETISIEDRALNGACKNLRSQDSSLEPFAFRIGDHSIQSTN